MRVPQKPGTKGSQKWMQVLVNQAPYVLDRAIARELNLTPAEKIQWLSPLADDAYAEYRDQATEYLERGKGAINAQKEHLAAAIEAGKSAYRAESKAHD